MNIKMGKILLIFAFLLLSETMVFARVGPEIEEPIGGIGSQPHNADWQTNVEVDSYDNFEAQASVRNVDDAAVVSYSFLPPSFRYTNGIYYMHIGQSADISLNMKNVGLNTWRTSQSYRLQSVGDDWNIDMQNLELSEDIPTNQSDIFRITIHAPKYDAQLHQPDMRLYNCYWQMSRNGNVFGEVARPKNADQTEAQLKVTNVNLRLTYGEDPHYTPGSTMHVNLVLGNEYPFQLLTDVYIVLALTYNNQTQYYLLTANPTFPTFTQDLVALVSNYSFAVMPAQTFPNFIVIDFPGGVVMPDATGVWYVGIFKTGHLDIENMLFFDESQTFTIGNGNAQASMSYGQFVDLLNNWPGGEGTWGQGAYGQIPW